MYYISSATAPHSPARKSIIEAITEESPPGNLHINPMLKSTAIKMFTGLNKTENAS